MLVLAIFLLLLLDGGFAANIGCQFLNKPPFYECIANTADPVMTSDEPITVSGVQIEPYGNADVSFIQFADPHIFNYFPSLLFDIFPNLENIQMRKVKLTTFTTNAIRNCTTLKYLYLYDNSISVLPSSFMKTCLNTVIVSFQFNQISTVDKDAFSGLSYVRELNLAYNNIAYLDPTTFTSMGNLMDLFLGKNQITSIHPDTFATNAVLQQVDLSDNKITVLPALEVSRSWTYLPRIYLNSNEIRAIDPSFLESYPGNRTNWNLGLDDNICIDSDFDNENPITDEDLDACYSAWLLIETTTTAAPLTTETTKLPVTIKRGPTTIKPRLTRAVTKTSTVVIKKLPTSDIYCQYKLTPNGNYYCIPISVDPITVENQEITTSGTPIPGYNETNLWKIDFNSSWKISFVPSKLFLIFPNVAYLTIINASLTSLTTNAFSNSTKLVSMAITHNKFPKIPTSFAESCTSLMFLNLANNGIATIDKDAFKGLNNLVHLYLSDNLITFLEPACLLHLPSLLVLVVGNNMLANIHPRTFLGLKSLAYIGLENNNIRVLPIIKFSNNPALRYVGFSSNQIISIDPLFVNNFLLNRTSSSSRQLLLDDNLCIDKQYIGTQPILAADFSTCYANFRTGVS